MTVSHSDGSFEDPQHMFWSRKKKNIFQAGLKNLHPIAMYLKNSQPVMRPSLGLRGGFFIMSRSGGLKPRAVAGKPSVTKLTHNNCTGIKASGIPRAAVRKIL